MLGTLICLAACGEFESKFGAPEDHAVPEILPHEMGLTPARELISPGRHIRYRQPSDWELYEYSSFPLFSYFRDLTPPNPEYILGGLLFHPGERVVCNLVFEVDLAPGQSQTPRPKTPEREFGRLEFYGTFPGALEGFVDELWLHPDDALTPAPVFEAQWHLVIWNEDYPAMGFAVAENTEQTSKNIACYWVDGARGDNEVELLSQARSAVTFIGVS
ncbi:MAG: hypothetical protein AAF996_00895 [Pseudomonadota bacterium]